MRYYKEYNAKGWVVEIGAGDALNGIEITQQEYETLLSEMEAKMVYIEQVCRHEISINNVPAEWREEVQAGVDAIVAEIGEFDTRQISDSEALQIITGGDGA